MQEFLDLLATLDISAVDGLFTVILTVLGRGVFKERSERRAVTEQLAQHKKRIELKEREDDSANQRTLIELLAKTQITHDRLVANAEKSNELLRRQESHADARIAAVSARIVSEHSETREFIHKELQPFVKLAEQMKSAAAALPAELRGDFKQMAEDFLSKAYKMRNGHADGEGKDAPPPEVAPESRSDPGTGEGVPGQAK